MLACASMVLAQNNTASPFSRYGYGELNDNVPTAYRALGGVGIGMRQNTVIDPMQPASFTVVDSTTFMFDLAASGMWDRYQDANGMKNRGNGNLEYVAMQFPIWKQYIGLSLGLTPYSMVGYRFQVADSLPHSSAPAAYHDTITYAGNGGITQVYGGLSFNICNWVALGANVYYMFGTVDNVRTLQFIEPGITSSVVTTSYRVSDVRFRYGAQFFHTFAGKHSLVLGAIFENQSRVNGEYSSIEAVTADTIRNQALSDSTCLSHFPMMWGVGLSYTYAGRFMFAADYTTAAWSMASYLGEQGKYRDRSKLSVGFQYTHNPYGRRYIDHMPWRVGFSMEDSYSKNINAKDYIISIGTAFPLRNVGTVINTTLEYGHRGNKDILQENYLRLTIGASVSENWFFKRRL